MKTKVNLPPVAPALLHWYYQNRRTLPFREEPSPYRIWVSEIMLQQTRVAAALPYYERFMAALPDIPALAACDEQRLHKLWEGLGYYSRVRNLQKAAQIVVDQYGGELPADYAALQKLPGIGEYTAGAIASIAFGLPVVAVDGNVLRVFSRLLASEGNIALPAVKKEIAAQVQCQQPPLAAGDYNQALMELGALVCVPGTPSCESCPLATLCEGKARGLAASLPKKTAKSPKQEIDISIFVVHCGNAVLLQQRPPRGLLAGLWQPLLFEEALDKSHAEKALSKLMPEAKILKELPSASHIFTHRIWKMRAWLCSAPGNAALPAGCVAASPSLLREQYPLPNAFKAYMPYLLAPLP